MIKLKEVTKRFGEITALERISLEIKRGEVFAIIGHNGAGKTTLLRILAVLEKPDEGEYYFDGMKVNDNEKTIRRKVTMVFQKPVMFNASVFDNVAYGLKLRGWGRGEIKRKVEEVLKTVNLEGYGKVNAKRLSGGEQQRVALARAIAIDPEALLVDEPTANLDRTNAALIEEIIKRIAERGTTVVLATHDLFQARRLSNRAAHLFEGKLVEVGETGKLFENPRSELTRKFLSGDLTGYSKRRV